MATERSWTIEMEERQLVEVPKAPRAEVQIKEELQFNTKEHRTKEGSPEINIITA
jgi:hypothetical protein